MRPIRRRSRCIVDIGDVGQVEVHFMGYRTRTGGAASDPHRALYEWSLRDSTGQLVGQGQDLMLKRTGRANAPAAAVLLLHYMYVEGYERAALLHEPGAAIYSMFEEPTRAFCLTHLDEIERAQQLLDFQVGQDPGLIG